MMKVKKTGDIYKLYSDKSNTKAGEVRQIDYLSNSEVGLWSVNMVINTDKSMFTDNKFNIEDTLFYSLSKVIINTEIDYSALNKEINDIGSKGDFQNTGGISKEYGDYKIDIIFAETYTMFNISLNK